MKFTFDGQEFEGPRVDKGVLMGFSIGELRWAKKALKVTHLDELDGLEMRVLYFVLSIRRADHTVLPIARFDDLTLLEFVISPHPYVDDDGACYACSLNRGADCHPADDGEDDEPAAERAPVPTVPGDVPSPTPTT